MLIVRMPLGRDAMRHYACAVVLGDWLGIAWRIEQDSRSDVAICLHGSPIEIRFPDSFFSIPCSDWLRAESLPVPPLEYWDGRICEGDDALIDQPLPVLFGTSTPGIPHDEGVLHLPLDVLGSIFFLLTGYEELVSTERDKHGRFPASASLAMRAGFIDRPLADEYAEVFWRACKRCWPQLKRRVTESQVMLSCDVDQPFDCMVSSIPALVRACTGDVAKRLRPASAMRRVLCYVLNRLGDYRLDPCYTFDVYLELCKELNLHSTFYFIPSSSHPGNGCYSIANTHVQRLMRKLSDAGHEIGMHGCYEAFRDPTLTQTHREQMVLAMDQAGIRQALRSNRQHYLRWDSRITPSVLDHAGFEFDSTGGFADHAGFRFGTAREFSMWDWVNKRQLKLRQRPLVVMDCTITDDVYMGLGNGQEAIDYVRRLRRATDKLGGNFSVLWHNDTLAQSASLDLLKHVISAGSLESD